MDAARIARGTCHGGETAVPPPSRSPPALPLPHCITALLPPATSSAPLLDQYKHFEFLSFHTAEIRTLNFLVKRPKLLDSTDNK